MDRFNSKDQSGSNASDIIKISTSLYNNINIEIVSDDFCPNFPRFSTWKIVKDHPKLNVDLNPKTRQVNLMKNKRDFTEDTAEYSNELTYNE